MDFWAEKSKCGTSDQETTNKSGMASGRQGSVKWAKDKLALPMHQTKDPGFFFPQRLIDPEQVLKIFNQNLMEKNVPCG